MNTGYLISVDPSELASRFPHDDHRYDEEDESLSDVMGEDGDIINISHDALAELMTGDSYEAVLEPLLENIPPKEADFIYLYFIKDKRQSDIAQIFEITQAAVSYRLARGIKRLKFLHAHSILKFSEEEMRSTLKEIFPTKFECYKCSSEEGTCKICKGTKVIDIDVEILVGMWLTTCQSVVAARLGFIQGRVRHRFFSAVKLLSEVAKVDERYVPYHQIFSAIASKKFNIRREVNLPQWSNRGGDECF